MELFSGRALETGVVQLKSKTNHQRPCLLGSFYLPLSVRISSLSILSGLYVAS